MDVDGNLGRDICPLPHAQLCNIRFKRKEVEKMEKLSCKNRLDQIQHLLTPEEKGVLLCCALQHFGGKLGQFEPVGYDSFAVTLGQLFAEIWKHMDYIQAPSWSIYSGAIHVRRGG